MLKKHINALQNLLIALLAVRALFLFLRQQTDTPMASYLTSGQTTTGVSDSDEEIPTTAEAVIRIAVSGAYGRYGDLHMTSTSDGFAAIRNLLQEALGSAGTPEKCSETAFQVGWPHEGEIGTGENNRVIAYTQHMTNCLVHFFTQIRTLLGKEICSIWENFLQHLPLGIVGIGHK